MDGGSFALLHAVKRDRRHYFIRCHRVDWGFSGWTLGTGVVGELCRRSVTSGGTVACASDWWGVIAVTNSLLQLRALRCENCPRNGCAG